MSRACLVPVIIVVALFGCKVNPPIARASSTPGMVACLKQSAWTASLPFSKRGTRWLVSTLVMRPMKLWDFIVSRTAFSLALCQHGHKDSEAVALSGWMETMPAQLW